MNLPPLSLPAVMLSAIPALFAAFFLFMYLKDHDERKLIAGVSFGFMSASSAVEIFGLPQSFFVLNNLYWWGDLPIIAALILLFMSQLFDFRSFNEAVKIFLVVFGLSLAILFVPLSNVEVLSKAVIDSSGIVALSLSLLLFLRYRRLVDALFALSLVSFDVYGFTWGSNAGVTFSLTWYAASFLFVALALAYAPVGNIWDNASLFKVTKQLDKAKERLKDLEVEYKAIFESANDAIFVVDAQTGLITDCNVEATKLLETEKDAIVGVHEKCLFPLLGELTMTRRFENQAAGASEVVDLQVITRKTTVKDVSAKLRSFKHGGKTLLVGVFRDVTEQKKNASDLAAALERLSNHKDKVESLNEKLKVVGGLTRHDVRNKLMAANNNAYLLKKRLGNQAELANYVEGIELAIKQCSKLLEFSSLYEKVGVEKPVEVNVGDCFNQAANLISKPEVELDNRCQGLTVTADTMLTQLFYNLIDNSLKHGQSVTKITLHHQTDNQKTLLIYEDNGVGVDVENKERIFSEGYTTGGSGLGLKLVKKMIEAYGWTIKENGVPGVGAKFQITIPKRENSQEQVSFISNLPSDLVAKNKADR